VTSPKKWEGDETKKTRMRDKAQPDGRPAVEVIETLVHFR